MSTEEKQEIINAILSAIRTNSKTINQLTTVSELTDSDYFELDGGRKVSYGVLMSVLDNYVTGDAMNEAMLGVALLGDNSVLDWKQSPIVLLESMGATFDDVDGGTFSFNPSSDDVPVGALYYAPQAGYQIFEKNGVGSFEGWPAKVGVLYLNKHTRRCYTWSGTAMVEPGNNIQTKIVIDNMNCTDLNDVALGQVGYIPSTKKLTTRIDARKWWSWSPNADQFYCDKANNTTLRWDPDYERFILIGNNGGMSPAIYNAIKLNVNIIQSTLDELLRKLANLALTEAKPNQIGSLSWPAQDGGDSGGDVTPVVTPTIILNPTSLTFLNTEVGNTRMMTFFVTGNGLTSGILLNVSGDDFSCSPTSVAAVNANTLTEITVTFEPSSAGNKIGLITVSSDGAESKALTLSGSASNADSQNTGVTVSKSTRNCIISDNTSNGVLADGLSYSGALVVEDTTTLIQKQDGSGVSRSGYPALLVPDNGVSVLVGGSPVQAYNNGAISINAAAIDGNIVIAAIAESPVILNRKISSGGGKYGGEAIGWCYNDVYIQLPNNATHVRWFHGAHSGGVANAYFAAVVMSASGFSTVQKVSATSSIDEQTITINRGNYGSYRLYILASFAVSQLDSCYIKCYTSEEDADNDFNGTILFDGRYATQQQPE